MQILIRHIRLDGRGGEEVFEEVLDNPAISLGNRNDQVIQVLDPAVAPKHVLLKAGSRGRFSFKAVGAQRLNVGGKPVRRGTLKPGQGLALGAQRLNVAEAPPGFDAALELVLSEPDKVAGAATYFHAQLSQTTLGTRRLAWILALAIPVLFLVLPLAGFKYPDIGRILRQQPLVPSDGQWISGPISNAHHIPSIGTDCNTCHLKLFEPAPNRACIACHDNIRGHVDWQQVSVPELATLRCANCHVEHNEPDNLVRNDPALCIDCHVQPAEIAQVKGGGELPQPASGFSKESHPQFQLALLSQTGLGNSWEMQRVSWGAASLREQSNLKFPHDLHLNPEEVQSPQTGKPLQCSACHKLKDDGEHFVPMTMETTCRGCHALTFDDDFPDKQLPHGDVSAAIVALEEHFIRKFADPGLRQADQRFIRRRPGFTEDEEQCQGSAFECGEKLALREAVNQFSGSGCVTCHEVQAQPEAPLTERWSVTPVRLQTDWYPFAAFDHVAHMTPGDRKSRDTRQTCDECHDAQSSKDSHDILIPGIKNCVECHGPVNDNTQVALSCRGCHGFHLAFRKTMKTAILTNKENQEAAP